MLSLFPGIGMLDMAFEAEGFTVVRGPDLLWGGEVKAFHPPADKFDGIIGGPPCQRFSRLAALVKHVHGEDKLAEDLIPEFARCVLEAQPHWFLMENVPEAPAPETGGYYLVDRLLNNRWLGEEQNRKRRFTFGTRWELDLERFSFGSDFPVFENIDYSPACTAQGGGRGISVAIGGSGKRKVMPKSDRTKSNRTKSNFTQMLRLQGLPDGFLSQAPFTVAGKVKCVGNGVPIPMGRVVARAVKRAVCA